MAKIEQANLGPFVLMIYSRNNIEIHARFSLPFFPVVYFFFFFEWFTVSYLDLICSIAVSG